LGTKKAQAKGTKAATTKTKSKKAQGEAGTSSDAARAGSTKKHVDLAEVRRKVSDVVGPAAPEIIRAIVKEAVKGHLAHAKYALESGGVFPAPDAELEKPEEEDSLAMKLLKRMGLPQETVILPDGIDAGGECGREPATATSCGPEHSTVNEGRASRTSETEPAGNTVK
jgi:hypothetical protein